MPKFTCLWLNYRPKQQNKAYVVNWMTLTFSIPVFQSLSNDNMTGRYTRINSTSGERMTLWFFSFSFIWCLEKVHEVSWVSFFPFCGDFLDFYLRHDIKKVKLSLVELGWRTIEKYRRQQNALESTNSRLFRQSWAMEFHVLILGWLGASFIQQ